MKIIAGTFAVFWSMPEYPVQFHADIRADNPRHAAQVFRALFPGDIVKSVRDKRGRFTAFT